MHLREVELHIYGLQDQFEKLTTHIQLLDKRATCFEEVARKAVDRFIAIEKRLCALEGGYRVQPAPLVSPQQDFFEHTTVSPTNPVHWQPMCETAQNTVMKNGVTDAIVIPPIEKIVA